MATPQQIERTCAKFNGIACVAASVTCLTIGLIEADFFLLAIGAAGAVIFMRGWARRFHKLKAMVERRGPSRETKRYAALLRGRRVA